MTTDLAVQSPSPIELIREAISQGTPPEVIRELVQLQQSMERFSWEREERQAKIDFDDALNACQKAIGRIAPNQKRENNIGWADYMQIDRTIRPVYIEAGFSVGFSEVENGDPGRLRMRATLSRGGISREYFSEIWRAPVNSKMNQIDADAAAASRVKRYLMLSIFNISVGIDDDEKLAADPKFSELFGNMDMAANVDDLKEAYAKAFAYARGLADEGRAMAKVVARYESLKKDFAKGAGK